MREPAGDEGSLREQVADLQGEIATLMRRIQEAPKRVRTLEERVAELGENVRNIKLRAGDVVLMDPRSAVLLEKLPRPEVDELMLEEVPDIAYSDIGGLDEQIEQITDAVELPFLHQELFGEY